MKKVLVKRLKSRANFEAMKSYEFTTDQLVRIRITVKDRLMQKIRWKIMLTKKAIKDLHKV